MSSSCEPDLFVDGFACCDQMTAHALAHGGYIRPAVQVAAGLVAAQLTEAGHAALQITQAA
jgi:acyl-coenzyme A thioesterase PaaI-like protein